jgi:hypothetical protein
LDTPRNFTNPVNYTVTAENGSTQVYRVTVLTGSSSSKAIQTFEITSPVTAPGILNEAAKTITVNVPFGTDVTNMTPSINHTGASISPASGAVRNFSNPVDYTVTAADGSTQTYRVTVQPGSNDAKAITAFTITNPVSAVGTITGTTITVTVPYGTDLTAMTTSISHTGASINPPSGTPRNFSSPQIYTVRAADQSTQAYTVEVQVMPSSEKNITAFNITSPVAAVGLITEAAILVTVPHGTSRTSLTPAISVSPGATVNPASGAARDFTNPVTYTVTAADGSSQPYEVIVVEASADAKAITKFNITSPAAATGEIDETAHTISIQAPYGTNLTHMTTLIEHTGASVSPVSGAIQDFSSPVTYTVTAANGSTQPYTVTVQTGSNTAKAITRFDFDFLSPPAVGSINENTHIITLRVPYGTDLTQRTPSITHTGASISPAVGTARNFTSDVTYTVKAADNSTQNYTVRVQVDPNNAKDITSFAITNPQVQGVITGTDITVTVPHGTNRASLIPSIAMSPRASVDPPSGAARDFTSPRTYMVTAENNTTKTYTVTVTEAASSDKDITAFTITSPVTVSGSISGTNITVTVPYVTNITSMTATVTHTGASVNPASGTAQNFTNSVPYTVTAVDGGTKTYPVTVIKDDPLSSAKDITALSINGVAGVINGTGITVTLPYGTSVSSLIPSVTVSPEADYEPKGGVDFSGGPVKYTVTAADGITQKDYWVTVQNEPPSLSSEKNITALSINGVAGTINQQNRTVTVTVPTGTDRTSMTAVLSVSPEAAVYPNSGTAQDFTSPVIYTVTAEDSTTRAYTVTVQVDYPSSEKEILSFQLIDPHTYYADGIISPYHHSIVVYLPANQMNREFMPSITVSPGAWISPKPETRTFTGPVIYTVHAEDGTTQDYTVTVQEEYANRIQGFSAYHAGSHEPVLDVIILEGGTSGIIQVTVDTYEGTELYAEVILPAGATISPDPAIPMGNYGAGLVFTVTAPNGIDIRTYSVELITISP